ncbi:TPA: hypothetical protein LU109_003637 [Enterobacter hormaechei subsp. xiangfangensis]|nr:hypothetical protein [Enterobacter hormaechei subsp. xiangfangensis]
MLPKWLRNQLAPEKKDSNLYGDFADMLQTVFEKNVEPILERISSRRSFFTMTPQDLETRMAELGRFFRILYRSNSSRPIILQQRLDEIHFKGTTQPIISTIRRELNGLPATWAPLYASTDQAAHPYGSKFSDESTLKVDYPNGDYFLTSRGMLKVPLNIIYQIYSGPDQAALIQKLQDDFNDVIRPLIPLDIVFDGFMFYLEYTLYARQCIFRLLNVEAESTFPAIQTKGEIFDTFQVNATYPGQVLQQQRRDLLPIMHRFDGMPIDGWALDMVEAPPIIPGTGAVDQRYRESANHNIEIDTIGLFGVQVARVGGDMEWYEFPQGAQRAELPIPWASLNTVEKITYRVF